MMIDITTAILAVPLLAVLWLLVSPRVGEPLYRKAIFEAHKFPKGDWSLNWLKRHEFEDVTFATDKGARLHGIFVQSRNAIANVLINHGNTGNVADMNVLVTLLIQCNVNVLLYDYRGFGKSESIESVAHACEDAVAAYDYLASRTPQLPIVVYGESIGGAFSSYLAQRRKLAGLIFQSCFSEFKTIACEHYAVFAIWPKFLFPWPYLDNASFVAEKNIPVLILHGAKDAEVNPSHAQKLYDSAKEPRTLVMLPNTAHEEISELDAPEFLKSVRQFLADVCASTPAIAINELAHVIETAKREGAMETAKREVSIETGTPKGVIETAKRDVSIETGTPKGVIETAKRDLSIDTVIRGVADELAQRERAEQAPDSVPAYAES